MKKFKLKLLSFVICIAMVLGLISTGSLTEFNASTQYVNTLNYNTNGGTGGPNNQTENVTYPNTSSKFTVSDKIPEKEGYTFLGWNTSKSATSAKYKAENTITVGKTKTKKNQSVTLYAIWKGNSYINTLNYDMNNGTGSIKEQTGTVTYPNTSKKITISKTKPTRTNYVFKGWSTDSDATKATYNSGSSITIGDKNVANNQAVTLYAVWEGKKSVNTLNYNANGGKNAPKAQTQNVYYPDTQNEFALSTKIPTKTGYTFTGWYTAASGGEKIDSVFLVGEKESLKNQSATLYAQWKIFEGENSLVYDANGGENAPTIQTAIVTYPNTSNTFIVSDKVPSKEGYTFLGWNTDKKATKAKISAGNTITVGKNKIEKNQSTVLYAIWKGNKYTNTLSYDSNSGTGAPTTQTATVTYPNTSNKFTISKNKPTKTNYVFKGWSTDANATKATYNASSKISVGEKNIANNQSTKLYAVWEGKKITNTLKYNANGGSGAPSSQTENVYYPNTQSNFAISSKTPTKTGCKFIGWYTAVSGGEKVDLNYCVGEKNATNNQSSTLYAHWETFSGENSLIYDANGGTDAPTAQTLTVTYPNTVSEFTVTDKIPTREGYTFLGWNTNKSATSAKIKAGNTITVGKTKANKEQSTTIYAIWKANSYTNTLTYDSIGGTNTPKQQTSNVKYPKTSVVFTISKTKPTKTDYIFKGWSLDKEALNVDFAPGKKITVGQENIASNQTTTLYAVWKDTRFTNTLIYDTNGGENGPEKQEMIVKYPNTSSTFIVSTTVPTREGYTFDGWYTATTGGTKVGTTYTVGKTNIEDNQSSTIYAQWKPNQYKNTLVYDVNGGTNIPDSQEQLVTYPNTSVYLTVSDTIPEKEGCTFKGWSTDKNSSFGNYVAGSRISVGKQNVAENQTVTLYAIWQAEKFTNTLIYDANGGTGAPGTQTIKVDYNNTQAQFKISTLKPNKTGKTFVGWSTNKEDTQAEYFVGDTIIVGNQNTLTDQSVTLYAIWTPSKYVNTLIYNANNGTNAPETQTMDVYYPETKSTFTISDKLPVRDGYTFSGWFTKSSGGDKIEDICIVGTTNKTSNQSATIYAQWTPNIYENKLIYDANGGENAPQEQKITVTYPNTASSITVAKDIPVKKGFTFKGWGIEDSSMYPSYYADRTITVGKYNTASNQSVTLYAVWEKDEYTNTLHYDANGGIGAPAKQTVKVSYPNTSSEMTVYKYPPTKNGYTFIGWNTDKNATISEYNCEDIIKVGFDEKYEDQSVTLYAIWSPNEYTNTLTYNANGGTDAPPSETIKVKYPNTSISITLSDIIPKREGYSFEGWYTLANGGEKINNGFVLGTNNNTRNQNIIIYAHWTANTYKNTLIFDANGGVNAPEKQEIIVTYPQTASSIKLPAETPTKNGYTFKGWATSPTSTSVNYYAGSTVTIGKARIPENQNLILYAVWK